MHAYVVIEKDPDGVRATRAEEDSGHRGFLNKRSHESLTTVHTPKESKRGPPKNHYWPNRKKGKRGALGL